MITLLLALAQMPAVSVAGGRVAGVVAPSGVREFHGIPFAAPPVGPLRWKPPQAVAPWNGVKDASAFGPRCMQKYVFTDMQFRSPGFSEDCLTLNVWAPPHAKGKLPVLLYFHGGGYLAGDASEFRYDGEHMARRGIVVITANYRLGVFGFLAHPELSAESPHHASGDYGLLDQVAALRWVQKNIA
ncbi:MAG TPA: carboxylesterase family protein, partial [Gemmatimonadales bacterium]|nr:carboxylesterase family protein [Gemmatimonadales bacterium]